MNNELIKRYSLLEISLFLIFAVGLFLASLIVQVRQKVTLTEPIPLKGSGVAVSLPDGEGWEYTGSWNYEVDNSMTLIAEHELYNRWDVQVRWRYIFSFGPETPQQRLQQHAQSAGVSNIDINETSGPHPMVYGCYPPMSENAPEIYFGIIPLEFGRAIELQVQSYRFGDEGVWNLFLALAQALEYETPAQLQRGLESLRSYTPAASQQSEDAENVSAFLIRDTHNRNIGYYTFSRSGLGFQSEYFELKNRHIQSNMWFKRWPEEMIWKTKVSAVGIQGTQTYDVQTDADGTLRVKSNVKQSEQMFHTHFLLPEVLLEDFARTISETSDQICIDILTYDGRIVPAYLQVIPLDEAHAKSKDAAVVVRVDYQVANDYFEELIFDDSGRLLGKYTRTPNGKIRLWDATTLQKVKEIFKDYYQQTTAQFARTNVHR